MSLINLLVSLTLGIVAVWTYSQARAEPPTKEILCACAGIMVIVSFVWFVVSAPWFLNLALLVVLMAIGK
ncbi:MAG: hypothetical protein WBV73_16105 [Phormidium sp.]